jgi:2-dehydro-3-deoxyglucarate aldolase/4-hydroxy-2-oxoheptanedioate aldolase
LSTQQIHPQQPAIGCWLGTPNHWACEILASLGYDAVFIDGEHGTLTQEAIDRLIALAKALRLDVYCRVAMPARAPIQQALDAGADALVLPQIRNLEHARESADFAKYPPLGTRGMGTPRSLSYRDVPAHFVLDENRRTKCFVMIETPGALRDAKKIAALPSVDGLFMGPYDLSLTCGRGQYAATDADLADADLIAKAAASAGKLLGLPVSSESDIERARLYGAHVVSIGDDIQALIQGLGSSIGRVRALMHDG